MKLLLAGYTAACLLGITYATGTFSLSMSKRSVLDPSQPHRIYRRQQSSAGTVEESIYDVLTWSTGGAYYTNVTIGTPGQLLTVILDTGSSDLYVDASTSSACEDTTSAEACRGGSFTPKDSSTYKVVVPGGFNTSFGDGSTATGDFSTDVVQIGDVVLNDVQFGVATDINTTTGFSVSLMGIGYSYNEAATTQYPNMPEILQQSGVINSRLYSVFLNELGDATGTILFGGVDTSKYTGDLVTLDLLPVELESETSDEVEELVFEFIVDVTGVSGTANGQTKSFLSNAGSTNSLPVLLDTGSAAWTVPTTYYNDIVALWGDAIDDEGLVACSHQEDNITLTVEFGGKKSITVPSRNLIVPLYDPATNEQNTTTSGEPLCVFMLSPDEGGEEMQEEGFLTLGDAVLRSMYVVFDLDNGQVSIGQAINNASTDATSSGSGSNIKVVKAGANGVASAVGSANSGVVTAASNTNSIAAEITASLSLSASTASSAVGTATGLAAIPEDGEADVNPTSGTTATAAGSGSTSSSSSGSSTTSSKGAASTVQIPAFSWNVIGALSIWLGMLGLGAGLVL